MDPNMTALSGPAPLGNLPQDAMTHALSYVSIDTVMTPMDIRKRFRNSISRVYYNGQDMSLSLPPYTDTLSFGPMVLDYPSFRAPLLKQLSLGPSMIKDLPPDYIPYGVRDLTLGYLYNGPLEGLIPATVTRMVFGPGFTRPIEAKDLPLNLKTIVVSNAVPSVALVSSIEAAHLGDQITAIPEGLGPRLKKIVFNATRLEASVTPKGVLAAFPSLVSFTIGGPEGGPNSTTYDREGLAKLKAFPLLIPLEDVNELIWVLPTPLPDTALAAARPGQTPLSPIHRPARRPHPDSPTTPPPNPIRRRLNL